MSYDPIEKIFKDANSAKLDDKKKEAIHQEILAFMEKNPLPLVAPEKKKWFGFSLPGMDNLKLTSLSFVLTAMVLFLLVGGIVNAKAGFSYLFSLDILPNITTQPAPVAPINSLSYSGALKIYVGRRIQFNTDSADYCSMLPFNPVFKEGTSVMLDNRVNKQIAVSFDGQPYNIPAYSFKIITLTTVAKLPHIMEVNCQTGKNNGSILLEQ